MWRLWISNVPWCDQVPVYLPCVALWLKIVPPSHYLLVLPRRRCLVMEIVSCDTWLPLALWHRSSTAAAQNTNSEKVLLWSCDLSLCAAETGLDCLCFLLGLYLKHARPFCRLPGLDLIGLPPSAPQRCQCWRHPSGQETVKILDSQIQERNTWPSRATSIPTFIRQPNLWGGKLRPQARLIINTLYDDHDDRKGNPWV